MKKNDWKDRLNVVYSTNPDFGYEMDNDEEQVTLDKDKQNLRVSIDKKNRGGKVVTLITGFVGTENDLKELGKLLTDLLAKVDGTTHFVYWQVTRGVETRNHVYAENLPGKLWVSIRQNHLNDPDVPIKLNTEEDTRFYHCNIKTLNLLPSVVAAQHAKRIGVQETVLHRGNIVTECAHSNVSILKDGVFYSHPNDEFILRGIAKTHMIQACYRLGITVMEKSFTLDDLMNADEIIVTSSSNFCLHACEVDGKPAGGKDPATLKAIQDEVLREYYAYTGKTTVVD